MENKLQICGNYTVAINKSLMFCCSHVIQVKILNYDNHRHTKGSQSTRCFDFAFCMSTDAFTLYFVYGCFDFAFSMSMVTLTLPFVCLWLL